MSIVRSFLALLSFLTILPVGSRRSVRDAAEAFHLIPFVSLVKAFIVIPPSLIVRIYVNPLLSALTLLTLYVVITRGLHIDGLADYLDAVGSLRRGEEALRIMKDPRKGSFAILAVSMYVVIFTTCVHTILDAIDDVVKLLSVLVSVFLWSDEAMFMLATISKPEPYEGLGKLFIEYSKSAVKRLTNLLIIVVLTSLLYAVADYVVLLPPLCSILTTLLLHLDASRRLGFVNGDVLGASNEISRAISLIVVAGSLGATK